MRPQIVCRLKLRGPWSVYILRCGDQTLYTGISKDVQARLKAHRLGKGAAYTRGRGPLRLLYEERGLSLSQALSREAQIKKWPRAQKEELIKENSRATQKP